jgi:hypothetical protein
MAAEIAIPSSLQGNHPTDADMPRIERVIERLQFQRKNETLNSKSSIPFKIHLQSDGVAMGFSLSGFLAANRETIILDWVDRRLTHVGDRYAERPCEELLATVRKAYETNTRVPLKGDYTAIDGFIGKITTLRLDEGFYLHSDSYRGTLIMPQTGTIFALW